MVDFQIWKSIICLMDMCTTLNNNWKMGEVYQHRMWKRLKSWVGCSNHKLEYIKKYTGDPYFLSTCIQSTNQEWILSCKNQHWPEMNKDTTSEIFSVIGIWKLKLQSFLQVSHLKQTFLSCLVASMGLTKYKVSLACDQWQKDSHLKCPFEIEVIPVIDYLPSWR